MFVFSLVVFSLLCSPDPGGHLHCAGVHTGGDHAETSERDAQSLRRQVGGAIAPDTTPSLIPNDKTKSSVLGHTPVSADVCTRIGTRVICRIINTVSTLKNLYCI